MNKTKEQLATELYPYNMFSHSYRREGFKTGWDRAVEKAVEIFDEICPEEYQHILCNEFKKLIGYEK